MSLNYKSMIKQKILCVDDEIDNLEALERMLRQKYMILKANSGAHALEILDQDRDKEIVLIISDQKMPAMTGVEFLEKSLESHPNSVRILLTGYTDIESLIEAINHAQIYRYLTKPWEPVDFKMTVDAAIERFNSQAELKVKSEQLKKAFDELSTLDKAKSNFMILINHELKTPLTSILNFSELMTETDLNEDQKKYINRIYSNSLRLRKLIDDTLIIVKNESKLLKPQFKKISNISLKNFLQKEILQILEDKKISIQEDSKFVSITADEVMIYDVLNRLLHNAIKFSPPESTIEFNIEGNENSTEFSILNSGQQMSDDVIQKIDQPFFINENIMNHSTGFGLGLTLSQIYLKLHESCLRFEYTNGKMKVSFLLNSPKSEA